jgi:hypothetical protein
MTRRCSGPSRRLGFLWIESLRGARSATDRPYVIPWSTRTTDAPATLDYAAPRLRGGIRFLPSFCIAASILTLSGILLLFVSEHTNTGVPFPNPPRVLGTYAVWLLGVIYVWQRLREDKRRACLGLALVGVAATAALVALPIQLLIWREDPGHPQSRFRLTLWPLALTLLALIVAAIGRGIIRRCSGPAAHASCGSRAGDAAGR